MSTQESFDLTANNEMLPNFFHGDKYFVDFSNIPNIKDFKDMRYLQNTIANITIPEYSLDLIQSNFQGSTIRHPMAPQMNKNLSQLMISYRLTEDFKNYMILLDLCRSTRYGQVQENSTNPDDLIFKDYINQISINLLDNHKRKIAEIDFLKCFCTMISSIPLIFGESSECIFTCNFSYSEMIYKTVSING